MRTIYFFVLFSGLLMASLTLAQEGATASTESLTTNSTTPGDPHLEEPQALLKRYFFIAAREGNSDLLAEFIAAGYDLNSRDERSYSALMVAAYQGQQQAVELLMAGGADPCAQDKSGRTALMAAIFRGNLSIARQLLNAPCNPDTSNNAGQTAAMYAALFERRDILQLLIDKGANLTLTDSAGNSAHSLQQGQLKVGY